MKRPGGRPARRPASIRPPWRRPVLRLLAAAADRAIMRRWSRTKPEPADRALVTLTRAANHSALWMALAAGAAVFGGSRGRRAARSGVLAIGISSAVVNGPFKLLFARRRPSGMIRLRRAPKTSSFPSGHSASAFSFAVAASREMPEAAPVLFPLAAAVAYSRVYVGVHYPSDVIAGAAFGAAAGACARPAARALHAALAL